MTYDIFFLSYMESNAEDNWQLLRTRQPHAKRVHGVEGVKNAHRKIAEFADTEFFFVIDGDNGVHEDFDFSHPDAPELDTLYVWRALNPVNDLCYGFGGIKLYNKWLFTENQRSTSVDIATSIAPKYAPVPVVASTTHFNPTALESWRGAFREAAKLTINTIKNPNDSTSVSRLKMWRTLGQERKYGSECIRGANMGHNYALAHQNDSSALARINDFHWLNQHFTTQL